MQNQLDLQSGTNQQGLEKNAAMNQQGYDQYKKVGAGLPEGNEEKIGPNGEIQTGMSPAFAQRKYDEGATRQDQENMARQFGKPLGDFTSDFSNQEKILSALALHTVQGDKVAGAGMARAAEGKGQRIPVQLIQAFAVPESAQSVLGGAENFITAHSNSLLSDENRNAMIQSTLSQAEQRENEYVAAKRQIGDQASLAAPALARMGQLEGYKATMFGQTDAALEALHKRSAAFRSTGGAVNPPADSYKAPNPDAPSEQVGGIAGFLKGLWNGTPARKGPPQAPLQGVQPPLQDTPPVRRGAPAPTFTPYAPQTPPGGTAMGKGLQDINGPVSNTNLPDSDSPGGLSRQKTTPASGGAVAPATSPPKTPQGAVDSFGYTLDQYKAERAKRAVKPPGTTQ